MTNYATCIVLEWRITVKRILSLLFIGIVAVTSAAGQETRRRVPQTESGFTKDEFEARRAGIRNALATIEAVAPIEAPGLKWFDNPLYVEDLRTSPRVTNRDRRQNRSESANACSTSTRVTTVTTRCGIF